MAPVTPPRRRRSGSGPDAVAAVLREEIATGERSPNEHLVEAELAARFGVGRATIRAALLQLAGEGLVTREPNRGSRVRAIDGREALEIAEVRCVLESLCAAKAATNATDEERDELAALLDDMTASLDAGDIESYDELNRRLHGRIRAISRQATAVNTIERLLRQRDRRAAPVSLLPARIHESHEQHRRLVEAIRQGDAEAASAAMEEHLSAVTRDLARRWQVG
jgi:DNA-binding GntR family transcriptional regulator